MKQFSNTRNSRTYGLTHFQTDARQHTEALKHNKRNRYEKVSIPDFHRFDDYKLQK